MVVLGELEAEGQTARVAIGELEALDGEVCEGGKEKSRVRRLDVLVNIRRSLLVDKSPEVGNLSDKLLALLVQVLAQLVLVADYMGSTWLATELHGGGRRVARQ